MTEKQQDYLNEYLNLKKHHYEKGITVDNMTSAELVKFEIAKSLALKQTSLTGSEIEIIIDIRLFGILTPLNVFRLQLVALEKAKTQYLRV